MFFVKSCQSSEWLFFHNNSNSGGGGNSLLLLPILLPCSQFNSTLARPEARAPEPPGRRTFGAGARTVWLCVWAKIGAAGAASVGSARSKFAAAKLARRRPQSCRIAHVLAAALVWPPSFAIFRVPRTWPWFYLTTTTTAAATAAAEPSQVGQSVCLLLADWR